MLSLGCGISRDLPFRGHNALSRCLNFAHEITKPKRTFDQQQALEWNLDNFYRIDPLLSGGQVDLDDTSQLPHLKQCVDDFLAGPDILCDLDHLIWSMLSCLFYFELSAIPRYNLQTSKIECRGQVRCRYADDLQVQHLFQTRYRSKRVTVGPCSFTFSGVEPLPMRLEVDSWYQKMDMTLDVENRSASISGFPESMSNLLAQQVAATGILPGTHLTTKPQKRKRHVGTQRLRTKRGRLV